jgi:single-stranded-DNA-specific exonuclease
MRQHVAGLTGVGIAFKLVQALLDAQADDGRLQSYLDLVALGTVADIGKLTGENRIFVKYGLERLSDGAQSGRPGLAALKQVAGLSGKKIGVGAVGFSLAPRINASGRLERADMAFRLLTTDSPVEARELASALDRVNKERQSVEECIWEDARQQCMRLKPAAGCARSVVGPVAPGVIGIVASKIVEEFYRPTALYVCKTAGQGVGEEYSRFDLYADWSCSDLFGVRRAHTPRGYH